MTSAEQGSVERGILRPVHRVDRFGEGDTVSVAARQVDDPDLAEPVLTLVNHEVVLEGVEPVHPHGWPVRQHFAGRGPPWV